MWNGNPIKDSLKGGGVFTIPQQVISTMTLFHYFYYFFITVLLSVAESCPRGGFKVQNFLTWMREFSVNSMWSRRLGRTPPYCPFLQLARLIFRLHGLKWQKIHALNVRSPKSPRNVSFQAVQNNWANATSSPGLTGCSPFLCGCTWLACLAFHMTSPKFKLRNYRFFWVSSFIKY